MSKLVPKLSELNQYTFQPQLSLLIILTLSHGQKLDSPKTYPKVMTKKMPQHQELQILLILLNHQLFTELNQLLLETTPPMLLLSQLIKSESKPSEPNQPTFQLQLTKLTLKFGQQLASPKTYPKVMTKKKLLQEPQTLLILLNHQPFTELNQ